MSLTLAILLILVSSAQIVLVVGIRRRRRGGSAVLAFLVGEAALGGYLALGLYSESRWAVIETARRSVSADTRRQEAFAQRAGDPGLSNSLRAQASALPRPEIDAPERFALWQQASRLKVRHVLLGLPDPAERRDTLVREVSVVAVGAVQRHSLVYRSLDGTDIPAYLFTPATTTSGRAPAVVVVPGHVEPDESGLAQVGGLVESYHHKAALQLAERGFVTLGIELRGFGALGPPAGEAEHEAVAHNAIMAGTSYKAVIAGDLMSAVDLLRSRPEIDPGKVAIAGVSLGGELAVMYGAVDPRVAAVVFNGYVPPIGAVVRDARDSVLDRHYCHTIPRQNLYVRQEEWFYLVAPRPLLGLHGDEDFPPPSSYVELISAPYGRGRSELFSFQRIGRGKHEFFVAETAEFLQKVLR